MNASYLHFSPGIKKKLSKMITEIAESKQLCKIIKIGMEMCELSFA